MFGPLKYIGRAALEKERKKRKTHFESTIQNGAISGKINPRGAQCKNRSRRDENGLSTGGMKKQSFEQKEKPEKERNAVTAIIILRGKNKKKSRDPQGTYYTL